MDTNNDMNIEIDTLRKRIESLETELDKKDNEIIEYLYKLEQLEAQVIQLEQIVPDDKKKGKKGQAAESKMTLKLREKDEEIRDLKDRMGFLRKEKTQLQQQLENERANNPDSSVIRIENLRSKPPLEVLVNELQDKVNKYKLLIDQLKKESIDVSEFDTKLKKKEEAIERRMAYSLQAQIDEQTKIIDSKNNELEILKNENEKLIRKLDVLGIQNKIKDQKIEELNNLLMKKKVKKKK